MMMKMTIIMILMVIMSMLELTPFRNYFGEKSKIVAALLVRLHEACYYGGKAEKAWEYLEEASQIYRVIPGESHPLYCQDIAQFGQFADAV